MLVTVFTPTYNRAYTIHRLYNSLINQTSFDFEWLIVDDGSSDDTEEKVQELITNCTCFPIRYYKKENGGKHTAINQGVSLAQGELFFIVDSDDWLSEDAIEKIIMMESQLNKNEKWAGVAGLKVFENGKLTGSTFKGYYVDAFAYERDKLNIQGDKAEVFYTDVLKKFPFPTFDNEKFLTENVVWLTIAENGYKMRWFNEPIYYCEYLQDGLSANSLNHKYKAPKGTLYAAKLQLRILRGVKRKYQIIYEYYSIFKDEKNKKQISSELGIKKSLLNRILFIHRIYSVLKRK